MQSLDPDLREKARDIIFDVENMPPAGAGGETEDDLLGVYDGVPLPERHIDQPFSGPDRIILYRLPLCAMCAGELELRREIRITILHELGHFFGFDEGELEKQGLG